MRTIRAMFGTTAAGEHRDRPRQPEATSVHVSEAFASDQIPAWKCQRIEIIYRRAGNATIKVRPCRKLQASCFRFDADNEVCYIFKQFRHVGSGCSQKAYRKTILTCLLRPGAFVFVIDD